MRLLRGRALGALPWILCLLACSPANAQRLPTTVVPEHYDLAFDVDLSKARFEGVETIKVTLSEASRRIVLHAVDIQFHETTIRTGTVDQKATVALNEATEPAAVTVPRAIPSGS